MNIQNAKTADYSLYPHMRAKFGRDPTFVSEKCYLKFINRYRLGGHLAGMAYIYVLEKYRVDGQLISL